MSLSHKPVRGFAQCVLRGHSMKTFLTAAAAIVLGASAASAATLISEFAPNPPSFDPSTTTVELSGTSGSAFDGVLVWIDTDAGRFGEVNDIAAVSGTFDANGLLSTTVDDFENPLLRYVPRPWLHRVRAG